MGKGIKVDPFEWNRIKAAASNVSQLLAQNEALQERVDTLQTAIEGLSAGLKGGLSSLSATVANDVVSQNIVQNACVAAKEELVKMVVEAAEEALRFSDVINMEELAGEICKRIDLEALKGLVSQKIDGALLQEARRVLQNSDFAIELAEGLKREVDTDTLTEKVAEKVAEKLDLSEIARIVAKHIVDNGQIDLDDLREKLAKGELVGIIAGKLDLDKVAQALAENIWEDDEYFNYDDIKENITEAITEIVKKGIRISFGEQKASEKEDKE